MFVERGNDVIFVKWVNGNGPYVPVLFLHSLGTDHRIWRYQENALSGFTYGSLDSRGHGRSTARDGVSVQHWIDDIHCVIQHANIDRVILCGISMGGVQALAYANAHPDNVAGLVIADSFAELSSEEQAAKIAATAERAKSLGMDQYADVYLDATLTNEDTAIRIRPDLRDAIAKMPLDAYVASAEACFKASVRPTFTGIPTLVVIGELDEKTPLHLSEQIAAAVPGSRLQKISRAAHLSNVDHPDEFNQHLIAFLKEVGQR